MNAKFPQIAQFLTFFTKILKIYSWIRTETNNVHMKFEPSSIQNTASHMCTLHCYVRSFTSTRRPEHLLTEFLKYTIDHPSAQMFSQQHHNMKCKKFINAKTSGLKDEDLIPFYRKGVAAVCSINYRKNEQNTITRLKKESCNISAKLMPYNGVSGEIDANTFALSFVTV